MVNRQLSFAFRNRYGKQVMIFTSIMINLALMTFSFLYLVFGGEKKLGVLAFTLLYVSTKSVFDYYLYKSKDVSFDDKFLYVKIDKNQLISVPKSNVEAIKRVYFYFYKISITENLGLPFKEVYYFISPNPSFFRQKELKEILQYAKNR